jgi:serine/threonine protein kinase
MSSAAERGLPELVEDSRIDAIVHENITTHKSRFSRRGGPALEKWLNVQLLGHGGDGVVTLERRIEPSEPNQLRAVKRIRIDKGLSTQNHHHRRYIRELEALAKFSQEKVCPPQQIILRKSHALVQYSDSFVAFYGWYTCSQWLYISMEYCEDLDLGRYLRTYECLPEEEVKEITYQLLVGLVFMHESGFAHRDLKPAVSMVTPQ